MTFKQGGNSWNGSPQSKKGVTTRYKCDICRREYKIEQMRDRHENNADNTMKQKIGDKKRKNYERK